MSMHFRVMMFLRQIICVVIFNMISFQVIATQNTVPTAAIFNNKICIQCHEKDNQQLVNDWRASSHARTEPVTDCISCHGNSHQEAANHSRRNQMCITCHGGKSDPVVHSYTSSKHGVLMRLEENTYDWRQPLAMANYRAPGCSYCHMHGGRHNVNDSIRTTLIDHEDIENIIQRIGYVCQDCHAPRYITRLFANGETMLEIGRKKVREAGNLITRAAAEFSEDELISARQQMIKMQQHLRNVYLGVGHQSPDYQWWHGQPALDGDLLRIKGLVGELRRKKNLNTTLEAK